MLLAFVYDCITFKIIQPIVQSKEDLERKTTSNNLKKYVTIFLNAFEQSTFGLNEVVILTNIQNIQHLNLSFRHIKNHISLNAEKISNIIEY